MEILQSLLYRRETFLSRTEWIVTPWKLLPKSPIDELTDLLFDLLLIYQQFDGLCHEIDQILLRDGFHDIIVKLLKVESALRAFYVNFARSVSGPLYWSEFSTFESRVDDRRLGKVFPISFHFPTFLVAQVITTYWSSMMAVHNQLSRTYEKLADIETSTTSNGTTDSLPQPIYADGGHYSSVPSDRLSRDHGNIWKTMARNVCQSVEYFSQDKMGWLGRFYILSLLAGCNICFGSVPEDCSRESSWVYESMVRTKKLLNLPETNLLGD